MTTRVLIVERPGSFRDELLHEMGQRGVEAHVRDDAMDALASIEKLTPEVVLVSDDPGPPGALGLCRVLQRKLSGAQVYRIGEPSVGDQLEERSMLLPRSVGAAAVTAAIFDKTPVNDNASPIAPRAYEGTVGSLELGPLLLAIESRWLTGRLTLSRPGTEREIAFVRGCPVHARSTTLSERLGAMAIRRGMLTDVQVEQGVDIARARGVRLGTALLDLGMLDAPGLMRLLAAQLIEQLSAACNSGATHARFVLDRSVMTRYPLLRMSSMTALVHAVSIMPEADISSVLNELGPQVIEPATSAPVERFLSNLGLAAAVPLRLHVIDTVATLRERLRSAVATENPERVEHPDVIALSLLRAGVFRMRELTNPAHGDLTAGVRTLSPPSLVNAAVRCAQSDYSRWPVTEITRARTPLEQAIDMSLHGKRTPEQARALALRGPEVDCDPSYRDVYTLLLRDADPNALFSAADGSKAGTVSEVRLRCHAQLKRVDVLESESLGGLSRAHLLQVREGLERTLALLPAPESNSSRPAPAPAVGYLAQGQANVRADEPPPPAAPVVEPESAEPQPTAAGLPLVTSEVPIGTAAASEEIRSARESGTFISSGAPPGDIKALTPPDRPTITLQPAVAASASATPPPPPRASLSAKAGLNAREQSLLKSAEPLIEQGRWRNLRMLLAADSTHASSLPPVLALLYAIALKEDQSLAKEAHDAAASPAGAAETLAIAVIRQLFGLAETSVIAVMFAKRLLRRRPSQIDWKQKPPASVSAMLVGGALLLGALVGFLLHPSLLGLFWK